MTSPLGAPPPRFSIAAMSASGMLPWVDPMMMFSAAPGAREPAHSVSSSTSMRSPSSGRMPGSAPGRASTRTGASWKWRKLLEKSATSLSRKLLRAMTAIECPLHLRGRPGHHERGAELRVAHHLEAVRDEPAPHTLVRAAPRAEAVGDLGGGEPAVEERRAAVLLRGDERVERAAVADTQEHGHVLEPQVGRRAARGRHGGERARHGPREPAEGFGRGRGG